MYIKINKNNCNDVVYDVDENHNFSANDNDDVGGGDGGCAADKEDWC